MASSFLPAIETKGPPSAMAAPMMVATGMSAIRTGQDFVKSRNDFTARTGKLSPIRSASITALLSPREMVSQLTKNGSQEFGIDGYQMPKSGSPRKVTVNGVIPKNRTPGNIEQEAKYRKQFPGAGDYTLVHDKPWNEQLTPKQMKPNMDKSPRTTMADLIESNAQKPEKSTPSPLEYNVKKEKFLKDIGRGGASLLQA